MWSEDRRTEHRERIYELELKRSPELCGISRTLAEEIKKEGFPVAGVYVLAPMLLTFAMWVLREAEKNHIKKLFFLARDGYPVYRTAQKLCAAFDLETECRYFYCSRYSLRVPMYSWNIPETLDYVCRGGIDVTLRKILLRSGFAEEELQECRSLFSNFSMDKRLSHQELFTLKKRLAKTPEYIKILQQKSRAAWPGLLGYSEQEGMLGNQIGIVDSGWTGTVQKSINAIRGRAGHPERIHGYYFGLFEIPKGEPAEFYHSFYFSPAGGWRNKIFFSNCFFEALFRGEHGSTSGYEFLGGRYIPVLAENGEKDDKKVRIMQLFLERYVEVFVEKNPSLFSQKQILTAKRALQKGMHRLMWSPTPAEAEYFGALPFSDDLLDETQKELAPVFSSDMLWKNHFLYRFISAVTKSEGYVQESAWLEATVVRSVEITVGHRMSYALYKTFNYLRKMM